MVVTAIVLLSPYLSNLLTSAYAAKGLRTGSTVVPLTNTRPLNGLSQALMPTAFSCQERGTATLVRYTTIVGVPSKSPKPCSLQELGTSTSLQAESSKSGATSSSLKASAFCARHFPAKEIAADSLTPGISC